MKHFLTVLDLERDEIEEILNNTFDIKSSPLRYEKTLAGKTIGLLFEKPSTRTRISFEVGVFQLGGNPIFMTSKELQLARKESIKDTSKVMSRYLDGIVIRTFAHETLEEFAKYSDIPVINGLTDKFHPCQALSDFFTIKEKAGKLQGINLLYIGDANNVSNSLMLLAGLMGVNFYISTPKEYQPENSLFEKAKELAKKNNSIMEYIEDPIEAIKRADFVYTDVWISMGDSENKDITPFKRYQLNKELISYAKKDIKVMHCLPAMRGYEITDDIMDDEKISIVYDQAENRLHTQKALMYKLFSG